MFYKIIEILKRELISFISIVFLIAIVLYSKSNMNAVKEGIELWVNNVIPSLFPFFIATEILCKTNIINSLGRILRKPISKIFNVPGEGAFALIMGTISGYPSGAKIVANLRHDKRISIEEAERLISFTNNSGPLFILGTIGISILKDEKIGYLLLFSHIISCLIVGIIFKNWKKSNKKSNDYLVINQEKYTSIKDFGEILSDSIKKSIITLVNIGGFIVLFSVINSIFESSGFFKCTSKIFEFLTIPKEYR